MRNHWGIYSAHPYGALSLVLLLDDVRLEKFVNVVSDPALTN